MQRLISANGRLSADPFRGMLDNVCSGGAGLEAGFGPRTGV